MLGHPELSSYWPDDDAADDCQTGEPALDAVAIDFAAATRTVEPDSTDNYRLRSHGGG